jgi:hypothetical protein
MQLTRERVIIDIEDLEQAAKVEETVNTGYCDTIRDNLAHWIAVEEDIVDSYSRLVGRAGNKYGKSLENLIADSKDTLCTLRELLDSFESLSQRRTSRIQAIRNLEKPVQ